MNSELIRKLEASLVAAHQAAVPLCTDPALKTKLVAVLRKLRIARELAGMQYIAVTGAQSAGKTRLVRELYGLDKEWLRDDQGRGERLPVFVMERNGLETPYGVAVTGERPEEEVRQEPELFRAASGAWDDAGSVLYLKLYVPPRYFNGNAGFVLLPGYEIETAENTAWQNVMRHTLRHSLGAVVVTDTTRMAGTSSSRALEDLSRRYFPDRKPVIAISKTEGNDAATVGQLVDRASEIFGVSELERDRIVATGTGSEAFVTSWATRLINALNQHALTAAESREVRLAEVERLIDEDIAEIVSLLHETLVEQDAQHGPGEQVRDEVIGAFTKARDKYRRALEGAIRKSTQDYAASAKKRARDRYIAEEEGLRNTLKGAARFFTTTSGERENNFIARIHDCWHSNNDEKQPASLAESDYLALSKLSHEHLGTPVFAPPELRTLTKGDCGTLLGYNSRLPADARAHRLAHEDAVVEMRRVLSPAIDGEAASRSPMANEGFRDLLALMPALAMEYVRINQALVISAPGGLPPQPTTENVGSFLRGLATELPEFDKSVKTIVRSLACILSVDALDGQIDTIPALIQAIFPAAAPAAVTGGSGAAAAVTAGASLSVAAAGVITAGFVAYQAISAVQRHDALQRGYIAMAIDQLAAEHEAARLQLYDDAMEMLEDRLRTGLERAYGLNLAVANKDGVLRATARVSRARVACLSALRSAQLAA